mgnify:FL=1
MDGIEGLIDMVDAILNTGRKRHIAGGILLSLSLLFGGLSVTVMTIKDKENNDK